MFKGSQPTIETRISLDTLMKEINPTLSDFLQQATTLDDLVLAGFWAEYRIRAEIERLMSLQKYNILEANGEEE